MQKTWGRHRNFDLVDSPMNLNGLKRPDRAFCLTFGISKGREVMLANQLLGRNMHQLSIKRHRHTPCQTLLYRQVRPAIDDQISIGASGRAESRIESIIHLLRFQNTYGLRPQVKVQSIGNFSNGPRAAQVQMRNLTRRVNPSIGSPGPLNPHGRSIKGRSGDLKGFLHTRLIRLPLPPNERPTVIFKCQFNPLHHRDPCSLR